MVCQGLKVDLASETIEELVASAEPISFAAKSILEKDILAGGWNVGQLARLENDIRRGDVKKGKKVKYYHWNIFIQDAPNIILKALKGKLAELEGKSPAGMAETQAETQDKPQL